MTLYMDVHDTLPEGTTAADVAGAHAQDLQVQGKYGVNYRSYWVDEANGRAWCLVEAPDPHIGGRCSPGGPRAGGRPAVPRGGGSVMAALARRGPSPSARRRPRRSRPATTSGSAATGSWACPSPRVTTWCCAA